MKKESLYLAMMAAMFTACSTNVELESSSSPTSAETVDNAISFQFINRNSITSRGDNDSKVALNTAGHYNFGVFAYKSTTATGLDASTANLNVMNNYLVGFGPEEGATSTKGYKLDKDKQTTYGTTGDGKSQWAYEKMGSSEYSYTGEEGYYKSNETFYMSNNASQYLKYWDKSYDQTDFFAYAPYLNGTNTASVATADGSTTITIPMTDGYDDASKYDFLAAHTNVKKDAYNGSNKVQVDFKRLSAKVKIGFYEEIDGYKVEILKLDPTNESSTVGVSAVPSKYEESKYNYGTLYYEGTGKGIYASNAFTTSVAGTEGKVYSQAEGSEHKYINFKTPKGAGEDKCIGTKKGEETMSKTEYYLIPDNTNQTGLTFHVSYKLTSLDGNETITVYNATVHVPYQDAENANLKYCDWKSNYFYTYIFKITKGTSGSTSKPENIDPSSPDASKDQALFPIIFDNCKVEQWVEESKDLTIN